jgi:hypothetical protein
MKLGRQYDGIERLAIDYEILSQVLVGANTVCAQ